MSGHIHNFLTDLHKNVTGENHSNVFSLVYLQQRASFDILEALEITSKPPRQNF